MFICFVCKTQHRSCSVLLQHLKFKHSLYPSPDLRLKCGELGCQRSFCTYSGFRRHLQTYKHVERQTALIQTAHRQPRVDIFSSDEPSTSTSNYQTTPQHSLKDMCGSIIAQLQASSIPENTVNSIVNSMEEVVNDVQCQAQEAVLKNLSVTQESDLHGKIQHSFSNLDNPFTPFNTETKRRQYFEEKWSLVQPEEYVLGVRLDTRRNRSTGVYSQIPVTNKYMYVPLLGTLKSIFKNKDIRECYFQGKPYEEGTYRDISDGSYFRRHPLFSKKKYALQILLYFDEFETANPLGAKKGIHKLGAVYFTLKNLPAKFNSVLMNIHLAALFYVEDLKKYGFEKILKPLLTDLKQLETNGIKLPFFDEPLFGTVIQVTGDNLALNSLLGFVECFSATYWCRFCLTAKEDTQMKFTEAESGITLRSKELHAEHCKALENENTQTLYGVKKDCVLNTLHYFHCTENFAVDIMHDLLEGVVQYELKLFFQHILKSGYISIKALTERIQSFNYGFLERKNRPSGLKIEDKSKHLGLNAIQTLCLIRNTPLIFGDFVEREDAHWLFLILLLQIVNIIFSPIVTDGMVTFLNHLICDHHNMFKELFPDKRLIPKHHLMIHYPRCIRKVGPLIHLWCMRFEAKHYTFKKSVKNFKNLTKSLVKQHQRKLAFYYENFAFTKLEVGPAKLKKLRDLESGTLLCGTLNLEQDTDVSVTKWIKSFGTWYQVGLFVCTGMLNDLPLFKRIKQIVIYGDRPFVVGSAVQTLHFDEHFYAYCIDDQNQESSMIDIDNLKYFKPFDGQLANNDDGLFYILPHCHMF